MFSLGEKARAWIDDLASGRVHPFAEIIAREGKVEIAFSRRTLMPAQRQPYPLASQLVAMTAEQGCNH